MKSLARLLLAITMVSATANVASAYHLSPPNSRATLKGILTFYPSGGQNFKCKVTMHLNTKGFIKLAEVDTPGSCQAVGFGGLPWGVGILSPNTGQFGHVSFVGGGGSCSEGVEMFQDNASGIWTLPANGQCLSGTLVSTPPVTIVP